MDKAPLGSRGLILLSSPDLFLVVLACRIEFIPTTGDRLAKFLPLSGTEPTIDHIGIRSRNLQHTSPDLDRKATMTGQEYTVILEVHMIRDTNFVSHCIFNKPTEGEEEVKKVSSGLWTEMPRGGLSVG